MDNSPIMFKGAINGFDKKAVISYIFELNESHQSAVKRLNEQLEEAVAAREEAQRQGEENNKKIPRMRAEVEELTGNLSAEKARTAELAEMVENLNQEIEHLRDDLTQKEAEAQSVGDESARDMEEKLREMEEKRQEVERASAQIGRLLLDATADADRIRTDAQREADRLLEKARIEATDILRSATTDKEAAAAEAKAHASKIIAQASANLDEANRRFAAFRQDIAVVQRTILESASAMEDKANAITNVIDMLEQKMTSPYDEDSTALPARPEAASRDPERPSKSGDFFRFTTDS